jgi:hypothetical protein
MNTYHSSPSLSSPFLILSRFLTVLAPVLPVLATRDRTCNCQVFVVSIVYLTFNDRDYDILPHLFNGSESENPYNAELQGRLITIDEVHEPDLTPQKSLSSSQELRRGYILGR